MKNAIVVFFMLISGFSLTAQTLNTWKGGKAGRENDWNIASNWSLNRVPDWTHDVLIPDLASATHPYPTLAGMTVEINSLRLQSGAILTIADDARLVLNDGLFLEATVVRGFLDTQFSAPGANAGPTAFVSKH